MNTPLSLIMDAYCFITSECDGRKVTDEHSNITDLVGCGIIKGDLVIDRLPSSWK